MCSSAKGHKYLTLVYLCDSDGDPYRRRPSKKSAAEEPAHGRVERAGEHRRAAQFVSTTPIGHRAITTVAAAAAKAGT
jgi:hypothetical protein